MAMIAGMLAGAVAAVALAGTIGGWRPVAAAEAQRIHPSALPDLLARYVESNPQAQLAEVAALANAAIGTHGVEFMFDAHVDEGVTSLELRAGQGSFLSSVPFDGMDGSPCGEMWVPLPLSGLSDAELSLVQDQQVWSVERPPELVLDEMSVLAPDGVTVLMTVEVPWQSTPFGVAADGLGVVLREALPEDRAGQWWANRRAADPAIAAAYPFLPLVVTDDGVRYAGDPALLRDASANPVEPVEDATNAYHGRVEFLDPHYIVDFTAPCT